LDGRVHGRVHQLFSLVKMIMIVVALFATNVPLAIVIVNSICCLCLAAYHTSVRRTDLFSQLFHSRSALNPYMSFALFLFWWNCVKCHQRLPYFQFAYNQVFSAMLWHLNWASVIAILTYVSVFFFLRSLCCARLLGLVRVCVTFISCTSHGLNVEIDFPSNLFVEVFSWGRFACDSSQGPGLSFFFLIGSPLVVSMSVIFLKLRRQSVLNYVTNKIPTPFEAEQKARFLLEPVTTFMRFQNERLGLYVEGAKRPPGGFSFSTYEGSTLYGPGNEALKGQYETLLGTERGYWSRASTIALGSG
jgi:hypothetical protein